MDMVEIPNYIKPTSVSSIIPKPRIQLFPKKSMRFSLLPKLCFPPALRLLPPYYNRIPLRNMSTEIPESKSPISADEKVKKFQQVFHSSSTSK